MKNLYWGMCAGKFPVDRLDCMSLEDLVEMVVGAARAEAVGALQNLFDEAKKNGIPPSKQMEMNRQKETIRWYSEDGENVGWAI